METAVLETTQKSLLEKVIEKARIDPATFLSFVFDFPLADMHKDWLKMVEEHDRLLIVAPRGHAKSSLMSVAYPCFLLGRNKNLRIKIVSCSDPRAYSIVAAIFRVLRFNEKYHMVFPNTVLQSNRPSKTLFVHRDKQYEHYRDASIESIGIQASAEGARANYLIFDDIVSQKNARTPGLRQIVTEQFYNVHINLLEPTGSKVIYIGSVWHTEDHTVHLMQKGDDWTKCVYAIDDDFNSLWPQVWPKEKLIARCNEIGTSRFNLGFRNFPGHAEDFLVSESLYDQCVDATLNLGNLETIAQENITSGKWSVVVGTDLAPLIPSTSSTATWARKNKRGNNVIFVLGIDTKTNIRTPIDIVRKQDITSPEYMRLLADKVARYKANYLMVESNAYQRALVDWAKELYPVLVPIIKPTYTTDEIHDAETGLQAFRSEFETRMWRLPKIDHQAGCDCGWCAFKNEITSYPFTKQRDVLLAAYQAHEGIRRHLKIGGAAGGFTIWST